MTFNIFDAFYKSNIAKKNEENSKIKITILFTIVNVHSFLIPPLMRRT